VTLEQLTAARDAAIECIAAASYGSIDRKIGELAVMTGIYSNAESPIDHWCARMRAACDGWAIHVEPVLNDITAACARAEPIDVGGSKFSTAHAAAYHHVSRRLREHNLVQSEPEAEQFIEKFPLPEPDEWRAMLDYEFRQAAAAMRRVDAGGDAPPRVTDDGWPEIVEQTRPVNLTALGKWCDLTLMQIKKAIKSGKPKARPISKRKWVAEMADVLDFGKVKQSEIAP
jgi:hypothetical protein